MKTFWGIIAALAIIAAGLLWPDPDDAAAGEGALNRSRFDARDASQVESTSVPELPGAAARSAADRSDFPVTPEQIASTPPPRGELTSGEPHIGADKPNAHADNAASLQPAVPADQSSAGAQPLTPNAPAEIILKDQNEALSTDEDHEAPVNEIDHATAPPPAAAAPPTETSPAAAANPIIPSGNDVIEIAPSIFEPQPDGSTLVDGRFILRGRGTPDNPYLLGWDLLTASREFVEATDRGQLPQRITMLSGTYVRITGHITFSVDAGPGQLLVMLRAWDGCCVGTRPTACDSVEVHLSGAATTGQMLADWGSVTGRFIIQPHVSAGVLDGLYRMEDATFTTQSR